MQKTLTVNGSRFTAKKIVKLPVKYTNGGDYIVNLNGVDYCYNYRQFQDLFFG